MNDSHLPALAHGEIEEVFPDIFFMSGSMETVLLGSDWQFSRNMTMIRENGELTLLNAVRLDEEGLAALENLGQIKHVVRLGTLHDRDAAFYVDKYDATFWALPGMPPIEGVEHTRSLSEEQDLPVSYARLFEFKTTKIPEAIFHLNRDGGILVACDALQNWLAPDEYFSEDSRIKMEEMGFFTPANVGPVWAQAAEPQADDFKRLKDMTFKHALCGHGSPLRDSAHEEYSATFHRMFNL